MVLYMYISHVEWMIHGRVSGPRCTCRFFKHFLEYDCDSRVSSWGIQAAELMTAGGNGTLHVP